MNKILHPFDQQLSYTNSRFYPVFIHITDERGHLSFTGVQAPDIHGNCMGGCGQIDMEYDHKDKTHNDNRYKHPTPINELRFTKNWTDEMWYEVLKLWHDYHLKNINDIPIETIEWLNNLPDTDRQPNWI